MFPYQVCSQTQISHSKATSAMFHCKAHTRNLKHWNIAVILTGDLLMTVSFSAIHTEKNCKKLLALRLEKKMDKEV